MLSVHSPKWVYLARFFSPSSSFSRWEEIFAMKVKAIDRAWVAAASCASLCPIQCQCAQPAQHTVWQLLEHVWRLKQHVARTRKRRWRRPEGNEGGCLWESRWKTHFTIVIESPCLPHTRTLTRTHSHMYMISSQGVSSSSSSSSSLLVILSRHRRSTRRWHSSCVRAWKCVLSFTPTWRRRGAFSHRVNTLYCDYEWLTEYVSHSLDEWVTDWVSEWEALKANSWQKAKQTSFYRQIE